MKLVKMNVFLLCCLILLSSLALADYDQGQGQNQAEQGQGVAGDDDLVVNFSEDVEKGDGPGLMILEKMMGSENASGKAIDLDDLRRRIQERRQEMEEEMEQLRGFEEKVFQNQNAVRLAVHSLLAMEDLVGGIGPQVREVAREFNNSVMATIRAEERIERRSALRRFIAGGDEEAAQELEDQIKENKARIEQLKQLRGECNCGSEVKDFMLEQVQNMELEQERLAELAEGERSRRGLFGWLWK